MKKLLQTTALAGVLGLVGCQYGQRHQYTHQTDLLSPEETMITGDDYNPTPKRYIDTAIGDFWSKALLETDKVRSVHGALINYAEIAPFVLLDKINSVEVIDLDLNPNKVKLSEFVTTNDPEGYIAFKRTDLRDPVPLGRTFSREEPIDLGEMVKQEGKAHFKSPFINTGISGFEQVAIGLDKHFGKNRIVMVEGAKLALNNKTLLQELRNGTVYVGIPVSIERDKSEEAKQIRQSMITLSNKDRQKLENILRNYE